MQYSNEKLDEAKRIFALGEQLARIISTREYTSHGYSDDIAGLNKFGFGWRKAYYYVDLYNAFSKFPEFSAERLAEIGWSKAVEICRFITQDNFDELLSIAKEHNVVQLKAILKEQFSSQNPTPPRAKKTKIIALTFKLGEEEVSYAFEVISWAKDAFGTDDENTALICILSEWANHLRFTNPQSNSTN
jgi:hypothetical protein